MLGGSLSGRTSEIPYHFNRSHVLKDDASKRSGFMMILTRRKSTISLWILQEVFCRNYTHSSANMLKPFYKR